LVFVLHWWHPVSWWARHELQEAEEECCDAWVVRAMPQSAADYADLIVETVAFLSQRPSPALPPLASGLGQIRHVRKRLAAIFKGPASPRLSALSWLGLVMVGCALLPLIPISAREIAGSRTKAVFSDDAGTGSASNENTSSSSSGMALGAEENPTEAMIEPLKENLALLRIQLVQKEAELAEAQSMLERASKRIQRGTGLVSKGMATPNLIEDSLTDKKIQEARVRGREANVQELQLLVKQEESRVNNVMKARERGAALAAEAVASASTTEPEPKTKPTTFDASSVKGRLDQMEKRLDNLFAEAMALEAELKNARARQK
jgi:hypothetical protein